MAELSELPLWEQAFLKVYPYRRSPWTHPAPVPRLASARVALITTGALHFPEQPPFDPAIQGGDYSYRWIPADVDVQILRLAHRSQSFDPGGILADRNLCFPLDRLRELVCAGKIGSLSSRHLSFMGSITAPGRLVKRTAPEAVAGLREDRVNLALLVPV
jgi:D-proline reductase (dithiol) PrdB